MDASPATTEPPPAGRAAPTRARGVRRASPGDRDRDRPGHRRPARARAADADRPARQQPRPARGRAGPRQDDARADDRGRHRLLVQPDPVHARPDARRHHRHEHPHRGGRPARLPLPAGSDLREPRPRRRDQPRHAEDPVEPARGDAGAPGHGRAPAATRSSRRSSSSRPRTRSRWRAPIPCPRPSSTASCSRSWSPSRPRRTSSRSWTARPAPRRVTGAKIVTTAAEIVEMQRLARAVPIAPHVTAYAVSVLAATHPDQPRAPELVREYVRYGGSPRGAQALVTAGKIFALLDGRFNVSVDDIRAVALPALRHRIILNFEGEAEGITTEAVVRVDPRRRRAARRRVGDPASRDHDPLRRPAAGTGGRAPGHTEAIEAIAQPRPTGVKAFLPNDARPDRLRRGVPAPARAPAAAHALAGPGRAQGRPAERQARPVRRVRRLPRLRPRRRPPPARLERLRPPREAVRQAVRRGGGRHDHVPRRRVRVDGDRAPGEAPVREARRGGARVHRAGVRGPGRGQRARRAAVPGARAALRGSGRVFRLLAEPVGDRARRRARPTSSRPPATPPPSSAAGASSS